MGYKIQKPCKICGKLYTPCADCENGKGIFHWRTVACSQKCASEYFTMVIEARNREEKPVGDEKDINESPIIEKPKRTRKSSKAKNEESEQIE